MRDYIWIQINPSLGTTLFSLRSRRSFTSKSRRTPKSVLPPQDSITPVRPTSTAHYLPALDELLSESLRVPCNNTIEVMLALIRERYCGTDASGPDAPLFQQSTLVMARACEHPPTNSPTLSTSLSTLEGNYAT